MSTIKCPQCNLVNWTTQAACKRCGLEFAYSQSAMPPVVNENFSGEPQPPQFGAANASYNAPQAEFQPSSSNPFASPTEFDRSSHYSSQNDYRQNYQQQNYQPNYQPNYNSNQPYQKAGLKIKLAVISLVFGIFGLPPIMFVAIGLLAGLLGAIFGVGGAVLGVLIPLAWIPISLICGIVALRRTSKLPHEYGGKGMAIGGIVLSSLTILIVPLVAAIAVPNLLAARRAANEGSAISSIRTLAGAEQTYIATAGAGNCGDLRSMGSAGLIDKVLAGGEKSGYRFTVKILGSGSCEINATPTVSKGVSSTGNRSFYSSSVDGWKIHAADKDGDPAGPYDKEIN
jgi:type IV pilus assembly protein PilA